MKAIARIKGYRLFLILLPVMLLSSLSGCAQDEALAPYGTVFQTVSFETEEGTAMNVDVSPDGREIVFDLLGDIYTIPIEGGEAKLLIGGRSWDTAPRYSPDGTRIAFVSDRGSEAEGLWLADRDGRNITLLTDTDNGRNFPMLGTPVWSGDGTEIILRWGQIAIGIVKVPSGELELLPLKGDYTSMSMEEVQRTLRRGRNVYAPYFSPDGNYVYFNQNGSFHPIGVLVRFNRETGEREELTASPVEVEPLQPPATQTEVFHEHRPVVSHSGRWLAYVRFDQERKSTLRLRDLQNGTDRELLALGDGDDPYRHADHEGPRQLFAFMPDDSAIVLSMNGKLWRVPISTGKPEPIPFHVKVTKKVIPTIESRPRPIGDGPVAIRAIRAPILSPDGKTLIFTAVGKLWIQELPNGEIRRLTASDDGEYNASISPDGRWVAYLSFRDLDQGKQETALSRVMLRPLDGGATSNSDPIALTPLGDHGNPVWSPDGSRVLFSRKASTIQKASGGITLSPQDSLFWSDTTGALLHAFAPAPRSHEKVNDRHFRRFATDERIYFLERGLIKSLSADGSGERMHLGLKESNVEAADFSPDGRHLILTLSGGGDSYLIPVPEEDRSESILSLKDPSVRQISAGPTTHVRWVNDTLAVYGIGKKLSSVTLDGDGNKDFHTIRLSLPGGRPSGTFAIRGARIIAMAGEPGHEKVIEQGTILVRDGRIDAVGNVQRVSVPEEATVIDGTGLTIIPGLIDVHLHKGGRWTPRPFLDPDQASVLAYGVTTRYDPSTSSAEENLERHEKIETGMTPGPRYYYSGPILAMPFDDLEAARKICALYDTLGVSVVKDYGLPTRQSWQYLARAAQERGLGITAHLGGMKAAMPRVMDGHTAIEHSPFIAPIYRDVAELIARSGIHFTPTLMNEAGIDISSPNFGFFMEKLRRDSPEDTLKYNRFAWPGYHGLVNKPKPLTLDQHRVGRATRGVVKVIQEGGMVSIGAHNPPGLVFHWEMQLLEWGGASPMDVLRAATVNGAKKIGIDGDVGTLEVGKLADLVVLTANPLDNIRNTTKIRYVVSDGVIYDGETMTRLWPTYTPLPRMGWQTPEDYAKLRHANPLK